MAEWQIDSGIERFVDFPVTNRQILERIYFCTNNNEKEKRSIRKVSKEIVDLYNGIPISSFSNILKKTTNLVKSYNSLKRSISRNSTCEDEKRNKFVDLLDDIFDVGSKA